MPPKVSVFSPLILFSMNELGPVHPQILWLFDWQNVPQRLRYLNNLFPVSSTIWGGCGTFRWSTRLEEVCYLVEALKVHSLAPIPFFFLFFCLWLRMDCSSCLLLCPHWHCRLCLLKHNPKLSYLSFLGQYILS